MFSIEKNGIVRLTRGDNASTVLFINRGTQLCPMRYELNDFSEVYVGVMFPNQTFENAIIRKKYTKQDVNENGDVIIHFESSDTCKMDPGLYYYSIKLNRYDSEKQKYEVNTIIENTQFWIEN